MRTREDLVQRVQSGTRRRALSLETDITEDGLLAAGVVAHAISSMPSDSREGIRLVAQMEFSAPESEDDRLFYEWLIEQEHATVQELIAEVFQDSIDETIARSNIFKTSRMIGGLAALVLIGLVVLVVNLRSSLFPASAPNAAQAALNVLFREQALTTLASISLLMLSIVGLLVVQVLGGDAVNIIEKRLGRRLVRPADYMSLAQAGGEASPRFQNFVQWLRTHFTWVILAVFMVTLVLSSLLLGQESQAQWMGYCFGVVVVVASLNSIILQIVLFRQRSHHIEGLVEAKKRYASFLVFRTLFDATWIFLFFLIFAPWGLRVMESLAIDWQIQQEQRQVATFEQNLVGFRPHSGDEADWEVERSELIASIRETVEERLDSTREAWQQVQELLAQMGLPIAIAAIGSLFVVALIEFVYVTRPKGILTLCVFFLVLLAAEFLPDRVTQLLGAAPGSKMWIFLSLVVAIVISIIGEFGAVSVEHGERQT